MALSECFDRKIVNMSTMLTRLGIAPAELAYQGAGALVGRAIRACQECPSGDVCRDWLARTGDRIERVPAFCPNAERFEIARATIAKANHRSNGRLDADLKVSRR